MKMGSTDRVRVESISTGAINLDAAIGVGRNPARTRDRDLRPGIERQDHALSSRRRQRPEGGWHRRLHRREHALDTDYAIKLGVDRREPFSSRSRTPASRRWRSCEILVRSGAVDVVVIDSVAALVPKAEIEGDMGDSHMGLQARLMSQALRKLTGAIARSKTSVIFINQLREKDRRHVWQPRDDDRWQGPQVLRVGPSRHSSHRAR